MLNSSRLVLAAAAAASTASWERPGWLDASKEKEEQSDPDNKLESAIPHEEGAADADAGGAVAVGGAYDLEDIEEVLADLQGECVDDSDSSDIVLTDSSAPSYAPESEDRWEDVTKEVCVDEELARLEGGGSEETNMPHAHG